MRNISQILNEELLKQKIITEKAQTQDKIEELEGITDVDGTVQGSVGKQKDVYNAQMIGLERSDYNKFAKLMSDVWSVQRSSDNSLAPTEGTGLYNDNIGAAISAYFKNMKVNEAVYTKPAE